jgi:hypothetical protein
MNPQFIRVYRPKEDKEILLNIGMIWKIEVSYAVKGENTYWVTSLEEGAENPDAKRVYDVFVGGERIKLAGKPGDPVMKVIEEIYRSAIK